LPKFVKNDLQQKISQRILSPIHNELNSILASLSMPARFQLA
jgi:hypothetical protein